jgi:hypothetical protein
MIVEKRMYPRVDVTCKISAVFGERILVFNVHTENLGEGGARFILEDKLNISTAVDIELFFPDQKTPLQCKGEIIWANEINPSGVNPQLFDTGVRFVGISEQNKEAIRKMVAVLISKGDGKR